MQDLHIDTGLILVCYVFYYIVITGYYRQDLHIDTGLILVCYVFYYYCYYMQDLHIDTGVILVCCVLLLLLLHARLTH